MVNPFDKTFYPQYLSSSSDKTEITGYDALFKAFMAQRNNQIATKCLPTKITLEQV